MMHNCSECRYLKRTSPEQKFLLCRFWSSRRSPVEGVFELYGKDYVVTHCHIQPEAPACPFFRQREVSHGAASHNGPLLHAH